MLGLFLLVHHYNTKYFPKMETVTIKSKDGEETKVERQIPFLWHLLEAIYESIIGTLQGSLFKHSSDAGSMIGNIGFSCFVIVIVATYNANLAFFFTVWATAKTVNNAEEAITAGYRFCASRTRAVAFLKVYSHVLESIFVVDPVELGGDGKLRATHLSSGHACTHVRCQHVLGLCMIQVSQDLLVRSAQDAPGHSKCWILWRLTTTKLLRHALISVMGKLEVEQSKGNHCDLFSVGPTIYFYDQLWHTCGCR